nr:hypothetical protein [Tanacetum cinerariifolium]
YHLYKVGLTARVESSKDEESLDDAELFDVNDLHGEKVFVEKDVVDKEISADGKVNVTSIAKIVNAATTITTEEIILAQALMEIKTTKPKAKGIVLQEPDEEEEEVAIDAIPLAVKSPRIVDWKIYKEGKKSYYQILKVDGKSQMYMFFRHMLNRFDREDLKDLYKLVKAKYGSTRLVEDLDLLLWGDLKTMFEPHVKYAAWRKQQGYKVLEWKLYDSCRVHSLRMQSMHIYMLVEKKYP